MVSLAGETKLTTGGGLAGSSEVFRSIAQLMFVESRVVELA